MLVFTSVGAYYRGVFEMITMKVKNTVLFTVLLSSIFCTTAFSQEKGDLDVIALFDLSTNEVAEREMKIFLDFIYSSLVDTNAFTVIDQNQRKILLEEIKFSLSGLADEEGMVKAGKLLSAQYILTGSIGRFGERYILNLKILEVETGNTVKSVSERYDIFDDILDDTDRLVKILTETLDANVIKLSEAPSMQAFDLGLFDQTNYLIKSALYDNFQLIQERSELLSPTERKALYNQNDRKKIRGAVLNFLPGFGVGSFGNNNIVAGTALLVGDVVSLSLLVTGGLIGYFNNENWKAANADYWVPDPDGTDDWNGERGNFYVEGVMIVNPDFVFYDTAFQLGVISYIGVRLIGALIPLISTDRYNSRLADSLNLFSGNNETRSEKVNVSFFLRPEMHSFSMNPLTFATGFSIQP